MEDNFDVTAQRFGQLSEREREVMSYVAAHYRSKAIARIFGTAPKTVDRQISSACRKLGVERRGEAVRLLIEAGLSLDMGVKPPSALSPISLLLPNALNGRVATEEGRDHPDTYPIRHQSGRASASDDLSRSVERSDDGRDRPTASFHGSLSGFGLEGAIALPDRTDGDVRDPALGQLSGRRLAAPGDERLTGLPPGAIRLVVAFAAAAGLALAIPAGLHGAVQLQKLVEALERP